MKIHKVLFEGGLEIVTFFMNDNTITVCVSIETNISQAQFHFFLRFCIVFLCILSHYNQLIALDTVGLIVSFSKVKPKWVKKTLNEQNLKIETDIVLFLVTQ